MSMWLPEAEDRPAGTDEPASPFRTSGSEPAGGVACSGAASGVPLSQSHRERLRGRRAEPSHEGGALDQLAQPPSSHVTTETTSNLRSVREIFRVRFMRPCSLATGCVGGCRPGG